MGDLTILKQYMKPPTLSFDEMVEIIRNESTSWSPEFRKDFIWTGYDSGNVSNLAKYHHSLGSYIRNKFNLWGRAWNPKIVNGVDMSEDHPDVISMRIIEEVWRLGLL